MVAVVGGGDNALKEAILLTKFARKLYLIHRRDKFRAIKILQERVLANPKIEVLWNSVVESVEGETQLEKAVLRNVREDRSYDLPLERPVRLDRGGPAQRLRPGLVELNEWGEIKVNPRMATSQPGIFAAGDVTDACPKQVATAVGLGVTPRCRRSNTSTPGDLIGILSSFTAVSSSSTRAFSLFTSLTRS